MKLDLFRNISKYFSQVSEIDLTGSGEPLMNPDLNEMVGISRESGCRVGFSTNGMLLVPTLAKELISAGLDWVAVSIDAAREKTYASIRVGGDLGLVLHNLEYLKSQRQKQNKRSPKLMIFFVMMKQNYHELPKLIEIASRLEVDVVVAKHLDVISSSVHDKKRIFDCSELGMTGEDLDKVLEDAKSRAYSSGIKLRIYQVTDYENAICEQNPLKTLFVSVHGEVSPCISLAYMRQRYFKGIRIKTPLIRFGNVKHSDIMSIFDSKEYVGFRRTFEQRSARSIFSAINSLLQNFNNVQLSKVIPTAPQGCRHCYNLYEM